ncbi:MAG: hypothetical protein M3Y74_08030 [Chloroflexota bacterium]|nr:hypothetical protein [Chloroflexota bacterium]
MMQSFLPTWPIVGLFLVVAFGCFASVQVARGRWPLVSLLLSLFSVCIAASQVYHRAALVLWAVAGVLLIAAVFSAGHAAV